MPKHKQVLSGNKQNGRKKSEVQRPEKSANEFLAGTKIPPEDVTSSCHQAYSRAVGIDFEEAGEKWRAGDAAKSLRFFLRAIDAYDGGLQKFPRSFDLSYNKARLQYEVAQQPRLLAHLPTPLIELLQTSLHSHRLALTIDQDNPDLLFNTAQVLTSLAEAINEGKKSSESPRDEALRLLQESFELSQRCLNVQEFKLTQDEENGIREAQPSPNAKTASTNDTNDSAPDLSAEEVWASVEEPVTRDTILDTIIAQLDTLTAIYSLVSSLTGLAWGEEYYRTTLRDKLLFYVDGSIRRHDAALAQAKFTSAICDAAFRAGQLDLPTYEHELNAAFTGQDLDLSNDPQSLCDKADAELAFNASVQTALQARPTDMARISSTCWKHITRALDSLTAAAKLPDVQNLPPIHLRRGDCELLRLHLGEEPLNYDLAIKSAPTLLKNAEVYFRGAASLAKREVGTEEELNEAEVKHSITAGLVGDTERLSLLVKTQRDLVESIVEEMRDDGLLGERSLQKLGSVFV